MKFFDNGRLNYWLGLIIGVIGVVFMLYAYLKMEEGAFRWLVWGAGLLIAGFSRYESEAASLRIQPFEKFAWRKARETYTEERDHSERKPDC